MKHLKNIFQIKIQSKLILFLIVNLFFSCTLQYKNDKVIEPKNLVTITFSGSGCRYSHIITINSNYELIYEIGEYISYDVSEKDSLTYILQDSLFPTKKRRLTPREIEQFNYYYAQQDSLYYQNPDFVIDGCTFDLYIKNMHVANFYEIKTTNVIENNILNKFSYFLVNLVENPYELGYIIDYYYQSCSIHKHK